MQLKVPASVLLSCLICVSCGSTNAKDNSEPPTAVDFPESLLTGFSMWTPVLDGDLAFASSGHSGQTTRVYFNDIAEPYFSGESPLPFAEGSYVAKAVVASADVPATEATRVYFMLKKFAGFDADNNDWSYAVSNLNNGTLEFGESQGKIQSCIKCHASEEQWDFVRTVDYHRKQSVD